MTYIKHWRGDFLANKSGCEHSHHQRPLFCHPPLTPPLFAINREVVITHIIVHVVTHVVGRHCHPVHHPLPLRPKSAATLQHEQAVAVGVTVAVARARAVVVVVAVAVALGRARGSLASNVANMLATCRNDTRFCSNFGHMGRCCRHEIKDVGTFCVGLSQHPYFPPKTRPAQVRM
jgi:hypothetical protein